MTQSELYELYDSDLDCPQVGSSHILITLSSGFFDRFPSSFLSCTMVCRTELPTGLAPLLETWKFLEADS